MHAFLMSCVLSLFMVKILFIIRFRTLSLYFSILNFCSQLSIKVFLQSIQIGSFTFKLCEILFKMSGYIINFEFSHSIPLFSFIKTQYNLFSMVAVITAEIIFKVQKKLLLTHGTRKHESIVLKILKFQM